MKKIVFIQILLFPAKLNTFSIEQSTLLLEQNLDHFAQYCSQKIPQNEYLSTETIHALNSIIPNTFNYITYINFSVESLTKKLNSFVKEAQAHRQTYSYWLINPTTKKISSLEKSGFKKVDKEFGMILNLSFFSDPKLEKRLTIKRVTNKIEFCDFLKVQTLSASDKTVWIEKGEQYKNIPLETNVPLQFFVGYHDNKPVTAGAVFFDCVAGIHHLATVPNHRRKGFGSELMNNMVTYAKDAQYPYSVLYSTKEGKRMYQKLGYVQFAEILKFQTT